jgi:chemotaxis response regulator CheB
VGIAGAEGGVSALLAVLSTLSAPFFGCLAVALQLPAGSAASFAEYLRNKTDLRVLVAHGPVNAHSGTLVLATDDRHLVALGGGLLGPSAAAPIQGRRPAADALFHSLAETFGREAVGVVLSGLGDDGSAGLLAMRSAGALTIAESKDTANVYGMPRAALEHGAALRALPSSHIATVLRGAAAEHRALCGAKFTA